MFEVGGLYFPEERHFTRFGDLVRDYGQLDRDAAYRYVKRWRRALDIAANAAIFSRNFANRFEGVVAFEPIPRTRECLALNVPSNVRVEPFAVADECGVLKMYPTTLNSGGSFICNHPDVITPLSEVNPANVIEVEPRTIDSFNFDAVDLIKLDVQGAEYPRRGRSPRNYSASSASDHARAEALQRGECPLLQDDLQVA